MSRNRIFAFPAVCLALLLPACTQPRRVHAASSDENAAAASGYLIAVPKNREADDLARYLAGLHGAPGSPFAALEPDAAWRDHALACDRAWGAFDHDRLPPLKAFHNEELSGLRASSPVVFYPFGGPDSLTVTTLFSNHPDRKSVV